MSFFDDAVSALIKPARQFGPMVAQIVISERHNDRAEKTSHPVEASANISDHIILQPKQVVVRMGWTDYGLQSPSTYVNEAISGGPVPLPADMRMKYQKVRQILRDRTPITIVTGKRILPSMVLLSVTEDTDERTENSLILTCLCEEIFLVQTRIVSIPPNAYHTDPAATGSPVNNGTKQLAPVPSPNGITITPLGNPP